MARVFFLASAERSLYKEERNGMNFLNAFVGLFSNFGNLTWQMAVMWGIGAMIDFGPLLEKPWLMLFGAAAQFRLPHERPCGQ